MRNEDREDRTQNSHRQTRIAIAAYYRAEARGFTPGCELEDWLAAEAQVDASDAQAGSEIEGVSGGKDAQPTTAAQRAG